MPVFANQNCYREKSRKSVLMTAVILTPHGAINVRVRNLSASGARVAADIEIPKGGDLVFKKGEIFKAARFAWARGKEAGIHFYECLAPEEMPMNVEAADPGD